MMNKANADKIILLLNLGSPDSYQTKDVKKYLGKFLMDERVIDLSYWKRWILVNGIIVPFRTKKSSEKYRKIWTDEGSPLLVNSKKIKEKLALKSGLPTYLAMRYGNPRVEDVLHEIKKSHPNISSLHIIPLYPHYAMSSYETAVENVKQKIKEINWSIAYEIVPPFYNNSFYIECLVQSIAPYLVNNFDKILFSYHGIPERHIFKTDSIKQHCLKTDDCCKRSSVAHSTCYRHQTYETTRLVAEKLNLSKNKFEQCFQSRLGKAKWLDPFTANRLVELPNEGCKNILVVSPSFVCDCLETLEEINDECREIFLKNGGENFTYIPCLNDEEKFISMLETLVFS